MNANLIHKVYQVDVKAGRNVIILTETHQFGREYIRIAADNYRYQQVMMKDQRILFERGPWLRAICSSSRAHNLLRGYRNVVIKIDEYAFRRLPKEYYNEFTSMVKHINERTMSNGTNN